MLKFFTKFFASSSQFLKFYAHNVRRTYKVRGEAEHLGRAKRSRMSAVK